MIGSRRQAGAAVLVAATLGWTATARAGEPPEPAPFLERALRRARAELDAAIAARPPVRRPPAPVRVAWQARRLASIDLGAPLLALAAVDVGGDGRAELIALTSREVLVLIIRGAAASLASRVPLPPLPPPQRPRDPIGTLTTSGGAGALELRARASDSAEGLVLTARAGALVDAGRIADFPLCTGGSAVLAAGRNYFTPSPSVWPGGGPADPPVGNFHAIACGRDLVDADGWPLAVTAIAGTDNRLLVRVARRCGEGTAGCATAPVSLTIPGVGTAVAIADVDHDGRPEVIASGAGAPGDPDQVSVYTINGGEARRIHQRPFTGGVVAVAAGDADGDGGDEVFAAARLLGSTRVDLWSLE